MFGVGGDGGLGLGSPAGDRKASPNWMTAHTAAGLVPSQSGGRPGAPNGTLKFLGHRADRASVTCNLNTRILVTIPGALNRTEPSCSPRTGRASGPLAQCESRSTNARTASASATAAASRSSSTPSTSRICARIPTAARSSIPTSRRGALAATSSRLRGAQDVQRHAHHTARMASFAALDTIVKRITDDGAATLSAAPGAGKTIFTGLVFEALHDADVIDRMVVLAPRRTRPWSSVDGRACPARAAHRAWPGVLALLSARVRTASSPRTSP